MAIAAMAHSVVVPLACEKSVIVAFIFLNANVNYCAKLNIQRERITNLKGRPDQDFAGTTRTVCDVKKN